MKNFNAVDSQTPNCPKCGATRTKRLIYGLIHYETLLELGPTEPDFEFGWVTEKMKAWHCAECLHQWGEPAVRQAETAVS